jgi:hypothetical protein
MKNPLGHDKHFGLSSPLKRVQKVLIFPATGCQGAGAGPKADNTSSPVKTLTAHTFAGVNYKRFPLNSCYVPDFH